MEDDKLLREIASKSLTDLEPIFENLADRIYQYRTLNDSLVPLSLFPHCLAIGGISSVVELFLECFSVGKFVGYALKKRNPDESGWAGFYHTPGTILRLGDSPEKVFKRLEKEIFGAKKPEYLKTPYKFGEEIHDELLRKVVRSSVLYIAGIDAKEIKNLNGNWEIFENPDDKRIVEHHRDVIKWINGKNKEKFVRLPPRD